MHPMFRLTTERLFLRHFHILDAEPMYRVFGDPEVMLFGEGVQKKEWIETWLRTCFERYYQTWGFGPYAIVEKQSQNVIGYCGLFYFPDINGQPEVEIGYRLVRSAWGGGYATEAVLAVRDFAFNTLGIKRLIAIIDPANIASIHVAEKVGMRYEKEIMLEGYDHPDHVYAITKPNQDSMGRLPPVFESKRGADMQIDFASSGGVANIELTYQADTTTMPESQAKELESLIETSNVFEIQQEDTNTNAAIGRADVISYRLTVSDGDKQTTLWMNDVTAPASVRPLLGFLRKLSMEQKRKRK